MTALLAVATLLFSEWPSHVLAGDLPRNVPVIVTVRPMKQSFSATEPLLSEVLIRNGLGKEIRVPAFAREPTSWNGETAFVRVVDIYRKQGPVARPTKSQPGISYPNVQGPSSYPVAPGESYRLVVDLRKWAIVGGWTAGEYRFNIAVDLTFDTYTSAEVHSDFAAITIR